MPATTTAKNTATKPPHKKPPVTAIDWQTVDKQIKAGKQKQAIAKDLGIFPQAFSRLLKARQELVSTPVNVNLEEFKKNRADTFAEVQREAVSSLVQDNAK